MSIDTWEKLLELPNPDIRALVEVNPRKYLPCGSDWTSEGSNAYSHDCDEIKVNAVVDDGDELRRTSSLAAVQAGAGRWFYDFANKKLYVRCTDNDDLSNSATTVVIVVYCWKFFAIDTVSFSGVYGVPLLLNASFESWNTPTDLASWGESLSGSSTINQESTEVDEGAFSLRLDIDASNSTASAFQTVWLIPGKKAKLKIRYKNSVVGKTSRIYLKDSGSNVWLDSNGVWQGSDSYITLPNALVYTTFELEFDTHSTYTQFVIQLRNLSAASSSIYFDSGTFDEMDEERQYMAGVRKDSLPVLDMSVDDIVEGIYKFNFGSFKMNNLGWWDVASEEYIWTNQRVLIKLGGENLPYKEYISYFVGRISDYYVGDEEVTLTVKDMRVGTFAQLPIDHYWKSNYPNLADADEARPIPIFYGVKDNIVPVCIDPTISGGGTWKIAGHKCKAITEVRWVHDGWAEVLSAGTDYVVNADKNGFDLNIAFDFEADTLEVDAQGAVDAGNNLIVKGGAIGRDILKLYLKFLDDELDLTSFAYVDSKRTYELCIYQDTEESSRKILQTIGRSVISFFVPTEDGKLSFEIYETGTPEGTIKLDDRDFGKDWRVKKDNAFVRNKVRVLFDKDPRDQSFKIAEKNNYAVLHKYGVRETLRIETYLKNLLDAKDVAQGVLNMCSQPMTVAETSFGLKGFKLFPTRKVLLSRERAADKDGYWDEKPFRIRRIAKDTATERVHITALDDLQSIGEGLCQVCYSCQTCYTAQASCDVCYTCELCVDDQGGCQLCVTCELCVADQGGCQICVDCMSCDGCQQCVGCMECDHCESCVTCMEGEAP